MVDGDHEAAGGEALRHPHRVSQSLPGDEAADQAAGQRRAGDGPLDPAPPGRPEQRVPEQGGGAQPLGKPSPGGTPAGTIGRHAPIIDPDAPRRDGVRRWAGRPAGRCGPASRPGTRRSRSAKASTPALAAGTSAVRSWVTVTVVPARRRLEADGDAAGSLAVAHHRVAEQPAALPARDHPGRPVLAVAGGEDGAGLGLVGGRAGELRVPAVHPGALAGRGEEREGLLGGQGHREAAGHGHVLTGVTGSPPRRGW